MPIPKLDSFTRAYIDCALWSTSAEIGECRSCAHVGVTDHNGRCQKCGGEVRDTDLTLMDRDLGIETMAHETLARMVADCARFQAEHWDTMHGSGCSAGSSPMRRSGDIESQGGHDFWLTRNGHGAGFWDGDWEEPAASVLTAASKAMGECWLYVGDDGMIYAG